MDESQARLLLKGMSLEQCIKMWNDSAKDHYMWEYTIRDMGEDSWWEWLVKKAGGLRFVYDLLDSGKRFNLYDMYFFYDMEGKMFVSFSTKQEFLDAVGEEFFINEIKNRK